MTQSNSSLSMFAWRLGLLGAATLALAACANVSHVLLYQDNHLGIKGGYNPETSNVSLNVGYKSSFATIVPKVDVNSDNQYDAASVYSGSHMVVHGLGVPDVDEITATGQAAVEVARSADGRAPFQTPASGSH